MRKLIAAFIMLLAIGSARPAGPGDQCARCRASAHRTYAIDMPRDSSAAKDCALCNRVTVGAYDLALFAQPTTAARITDWMFLYHTGGFVEAALFGNDSCTTHMDGALLNAGNGTLRSGPSAPNVPPDGPIQGVDYLFTGAIQDTGAGYQINIVLETGYSRETVTSTSFTMPYGFSPADLQTQSNAAAAVIGPLDTTLAKYEKNKRDTNTNVAIGEKGTPGTSPGLRITMGADSLKPGDSTDVYLQLIDCDGHPLANREIILEAFKDPDLGPFPGPVGGTVSPSRVFTDSDGNVKTTFTADGSAKVASIPAASLYYRPPGNKLAFVANGMVNLQPAALWRVQLDIYSEDTISQDWILMDGHPGDMTEHMEQSTTESAYHVDYTCEDSSECGFNMMMADFGGSAAAGFFTSTSDATKMTGYTRINDYKRFYNSQWENDPHAYDLKFVEQIALQSRTFNGSGVYLTGGGLGLDFGELQFDVDAVGTDTEINSSFDTRTGWSDGEGWTRPNTDWPAGMSCKPTDDGAVWKTLDTGGLVITCIQSKDNNDPDHSRTEHTETRLFFKMTPIPAAAQ